MTDINVVQLGIVLPRLGGESSSRYSGMLHLAAPDPGDAPETPRRCGWATPLQTVLPRPQSRASSSAQQPHLPGDCLHIK